MESAHLLHLLCPHHGFHDHESTIAITLRLLYLGAAVAIVFLVNRFFFPMKKDTQFRYNLKALFRLNNSYWDIIRQGTRAETSLSVSNEILTYFHMLYQECAGYLTKEQASLTGKACVWFF